MTLTIDLTPEQEAKLQAEADASGMALPEFAKLRLLQDPTVKPGAFLARPARRRKKLV